MEIEDNIPIHDLYRRGVKGVKSRPIVVKLQHQSDKAKIFSHASNLKGKTNARRKLFTVHDDSTEKQAETNRLYRDLIQENRDLEGNQKKNIRMKRGRIAINNRQYQPVVHKPKLEKILKATPSQMEEILATKMLEGDSHTEDNSRVLLLCTENKDCGRCKMRAHQVQCLVCRCDTYFMCL